ncbi:MAG: hypothetical protein O7A71_00265, partial [Chloroflexi bacterium]|nr:hypothetical protein [Chloroflexota bacterium]
MPGSVTAARLEVGSLPALSVAAETAKNVIRKTAAAVAPVPANHKYWRGFLRMWLIKVESWFTMPSALVAYR